MDYDIPEDIILKCIEADKKVHRGGTGVPFSDRYRAGVIASLQTFLEEMNAKSRSS